MSRPARQKPSRPRTIAPANDDAPQIANDNRPCLILLGDVTLISRRPIDMLSPGELARVNRIEAAIRGKNRREASRLALDYEASQGITTDERIAAMAPANDVDRAIEIAVSLALSSYAEAYAPPPPTKKVKRPKGHKKPKPPTVDPLEGLKPGDLTQNEIDRLMAADANLKSEDENVRAKALGTIKCIQRAASKRATDASLRSASEELVLLERLRDPHVQITASERFEHKGRLHLSNRDGLEALWIEGKLDDRQRASGRKYRSAFEQAERSLQSNAQAILRRMMSGCAPSTGEQDDRSPAVDEVRRMEGPVRRSTDKTNERGRRLLCLREVAGKGHTIRAVSGGGKAHSSHMLSLKAALDAIP